MAQQICLIREDQETRLQREQVQFALDVLIGLRKKPRQLASKYFYDETGSRLFQKITALPEYYLTRAESEILRTHRQQLVNQMGREDFNLVELGPGDGQKTIRLLEWLREKDIRVTYLPIDISRTALEMLLENLAQTLPELEVKGLVSEYMSGLQWLAAQTRKRNVVLFLGSNIGNFTPTQREAFLTALWYSLNPGDQVLIGFDLVKEPALLNRAYNDAQGITREFNLNLLRRVNKTFQGNFDLDQFEFYASFNPLSRAVESYLISKQAQQVYLAELQFRFHLEEREPILTEYSFKFTLPQIHQLAAEHGFRVIDDFQDRQRYFVDSLWQVEK